MGIITSEQIEAIRLRANNSKLNPFQLGESLIFQNHHHEDVLSLLSEIDRLNAVVSTLEGILTKKPKQQEVVVRVKKESEYSSWENFPY